MFDPTRRFVWVMPPQSIASLFAKVRAESERLTAPLSAEDQTIQSMPDTSPTKWHLAHTTWFFETFVLGPHEPDFKPYDENYAFLFNSYYEQAGARHPRPHRGMISRPGVEGVSSYRDDVTRRVEALLRGPQGDNDDVLALVELGCHHEQQHQELILMDIKHVLSLNPTAPSYELRPPVAAADPGDLGWVGFEGGIVPIGRSDRHDGFSFDNEGPHHDVLLRPFAIADRLITCGEWLDFMADGGYQRPELWMSDGWHRRTADGWESPLYWLRDSAEWFVHTLLGTRHVDPHEPVAHVSFYEADAYATWCGHRLATEFEWEHAAAGIEVNGSFADSNALHPTPAGPADGSVRQLFGDCWEWTESAYRPYPGFRPVDGAIGEYNGKFMINTMVLRGGCAFTPAGHTRQTYRNFFHPHTRWHLSGVRLAR